ncbi:hypothetical protein JR316_0001610 [Psilocybe cubensis]|uniref:Uncharacterized protein n=2 Tax=Psilocybe cubensis TaxID=181762 RepID=A0ACB8HAG1_PSICU|nr:hypothetical protein JR316_0001610 [Psilocybe cubensis]KAH9484710.1 hypothetical protein JR316_0001610 [Psilocybe cubensis]
MVNVAARLPFNLHNKKSKHSSFSRSGTHLERSTSTSTPSTSSPSRSASTSTGTSRSTRNVHRPSLNFTPYSTGNAHGNVGAPLTPATPVFPASVHGGMPSRSSSRGSRDTSLHDHDFDDPDRPILNVRLVRGVPFAPSHSSSSAAAARGRGRGRGDALHMDGSRLRGRPKRKDMEGSPDLRQDHEAGQALAPAHEPSRSSSRSSGASTSSSSPSPSLASPSPARKFTTAPESDTEPAERPTLYISPVSMSGVGFKLQDAGPLIVSWGD